MKRWRRLLPKGLVEILLGMILLQNPLQSTQFKISADHPIEYDAEKNTAVASGNALVRIDGDGYIYGDELRYDAPLLSASGNVQFNHNESLMIGNSLQYNMESKDIFADRMRLGMPPLYLEAESVESHGDCLAKRLTTLHNARAYFGEPGSFTFNVKAREIRIHSMKRVHFRDVDLYLGNLWLGHMASYTQFIYSPPFYLRAHYGHREDLGFFGEHRLLWSWNEYLRYGGDMDFYSKRGVLIGPAFEWRRHSESQQTDWKFNSGYIRDGGDRGWDILGRPIKPDRYFLDSNYKQYIGQNTTLTGTFFIWSDSDVERDFRNDEFMRNQYPDNVFEFATAQKNTLVSGTLRLRPNSFETVTSRLPDLRYDFLPQRIRKSSFFGEGFLDYGYLRTDNALPGEIDVACSRWDGYFGLSRPIKHRQWMSIRPLAGVRGTFYDWTWDGKNYTRLLGQVGCDVEWNFVGDWNFSLPRWGIHGIRHRLTPLLQYRYIPHADVGQQRLPLLDEFIANHNLPLLDLSERRNVDQLFSENVLRLGLKNLLQTSHGERYRTLLEFNFYEDIRFDRQPGQRSFSDLYSIANLWPADFFSLYMFNRFDPEVLTLRELRLGFFLKDGRLWNLSCGTEYFQHRTDQYNASFYYRLNTRNWLRFFWRYDARIHSFVEQRYHFYRRLDRSWLFDVRLIVRSHAKREENYQFGAGISLVY